jgi:hypothetical protein
MGDSLFPWELSAKEEDRRVNRKLQYNVGAGIRQFGIIVKE